jgi:O-antigen/teichoic acid export membrane protein
MATIAQTLPRRTLLNTAAIFGGEAFSRLATFLMALIVARRFGAEALGQYGYALALASVLLLVPDFGLHLLTTRKLAAHPRELPRLFWSLHWLKLPLIAAVGVFTLAFGHWIVADEGRRLLLYVLVARALLQTFSLAYMAIFKALEQMQHIALIQFVNAALVVASALAALELRLGAPAVVAAFLVGQAAESLLAWRIIHRRFPPGRIPALDGRYLLCMCIAAAPIGLTAVLQAVSLRVDLLILSIFVPNRELGRFQAAQWFVIGTYLATALLMSVAFPKVSRLLDTTGEKGTAYVTSLLKHGLLATTLASFGAWLGAPWWLHGLFGNELAASAHLLRMLAPVLPLVGLNTMLFFVFVAARRRAAYLGTLTVGVVVGAALGFSLVPRYGPEGSVLAALVREFVMTATFLYLLTREKLAPVAGRTMLRLLFAVTLAAVLGAGVLGSRVSAAAWPGTWSGLVFLGTFLFAGRPRRRELLLLADEEA